MQKRPIGITILSLLGVIGGLSLLIFSFFLAESLASATELTGISSIAMRANMAILGSWGLVSGIGMWKGRKWGWWLGATYISYSVLRNANALLTISDISSQFPDQDIDTTKYYIKHTGRVIFHSLIACYYFKGNVLDFFRIGSGKRWKRILAYLGISTIISITMAVLTMVL